MNVARTFDAGVVSTVLGHPEIWNAITEDGADQFVPDVEGECWLVMADDSLVGVYRLHALNSVMLQIHAHVLPEQRDKSDETAKLALDWIWNNTAYHKVIAQIPVIYPHVIGFTEKHGFVEEGRLKNSFLKDGKLVDQVIMATERTYEQCH